MLKLCRDMPKAIPVPLGGSAVWRVRPATSFEVDLAAAEAARVIAGLLTGADAARTVALALGDEFNGADYADESWRVAASHRISLIELLVLCGEPTWEGVVDDDGAKIPGPTRELIALLLRDAEIEKRLHTSISSAVHTEYDEGKE